MEIRLQRLRKHTSHASLLAAVIVTLVGPEVVVAQGVDADDGIAVDTAALGSGPYSRMHMLLEKTIFKVDVLALELRLGNVATSRLESLLKNPAPASPDSIAAIALGTDEALATISFRRDVGLDRFLGGIRSSLEKAAEAGLISAEDFETISDALPGWYAFLRERGIRSGDRMLQRIRGDTLRTVYVTAGGEILLDQADVGPERRLSVLGGYFAPGSDFRDELIASLPGVD